MSVCLPVCLSACLSVSKCSAVLTSALPAYCLCILTEVLQHHEDVGQQVLCGRLREEEEGPGRREGGKEEGKEEEEEERRGKRR